LILNFFFFTDLERLAGRQPASERALKVTKVTNHKSDARIAFSGLKLAGNDTPLAVLEKVLNSVQKVFKR